MQGTTPVRAGIKQDVIVNDVVSWVQDRIQVEVQTAPTQPAKPPPQQKFICKECEVEWRGVGGRNCWVCGEEGATGGYGSK